MCVHISCSLYFISRKFIYLFVLGKKTSCDPLNCNLKSPRCRFTNSINLGKTSAQKPKWTERGRGCSETFPGHVASVNAGPLANVINALAHSSTDNRVSLLTVLNSLCHVEVMEVEPLCVGSQRVWLAPLTALRPPPGG